MEIDDDTTTNDSKTGSASGSSTSTASKAAQLNKSSHTITADTPLYNADDIDADIADDDDDYNMIQLAPELGDTSMKVHNIT